VLFGRNRESRSREAAGRSNWPEAVPRKMRERKREADSTEREFGARPRAVEPSRNTAESDGTYSVRRARAGEIELARRAGTRVATNPKTASTITASKRITGLYGLSP
jgi:hypothetical protein